MRAVATTVALSGSHLPTNRNMVPAVRRASAWDRLFHRRQKPTLYQRCLAVHIATAGTLSALR
jgi:hypothetical protein